MSRKRVPSQPPLTDRPQPTTSMHSPVGVSFRRIVAGSEHCLSQCVQDDVREFMDCFRQLTTLTWMQVLQTAGKGQNKAGLGYTPYPDHVLRGVTRPAWLSEDVKIVGLRGSQRLRVFGYYTDHIFYVLWFDRDHAIVRG